MDQRQIRDIQRGSLAQQQEINAVIGTLLGHKLLRRLLQRDLAETILNRDFPGRHHTEITGISRILDQLSRLDR